MVLMALVVAAIIFVERGHRRVTVQYAKRVVGRRMYGGSSTHIPLKVNTGGVIPVIFASSILAFPATIASAFKGPWVDSLVQQLNIGMPLHNLLYVVGIMFFAYFYTAIIFNPDDVAENMRKYGGFIPGIRPGKRTAEYIDTILTRITLAGAVYLAIIAILPQWLMSGFRVAPIPFIGERLDAMLPRFITDGMNVTFFFGGTSLLDRRGRGDGHGAAGGDPAHHAPLRRLHEEDAASRPAWVDRGDQRHHARASGGGKRHAGRARGAHARDSQDFDGRHPARRGAARTRRSARASQAVMDRGELVSDDVMIGIVTERLGRPDVANGFVLDGFPRTVAQAAALDGLMDGRDPLIVLDIVVPESELARRLGTRMICEDVRAQRRRHEKPSPGVLPSAAAG